jgi:MFS family permease
MGTSIYTPGVIQVKERFSVSTTAALVPFSVYTLALGFGPVFAAPLSETFARRGVLLSSPIFGCSFTLGAGFAPTFPTLMILRFFAGM